MFGFCNYYSFLLLSLTVFGLILGTRKNRNYKDFLFAVAACFYCMTAAFRGDTVGGDLYGYFLHLERVQDTSSFFSLRSLITSGYEPGYTTFVKVITAISTKRRFFIFTTALLSLLGPFSFIKRYSPWPFFSLLLYMMLGFYTNTFNNIRQSLAISFVFLGVPFVFSRRFFPFLLTIAAASLFHISAIAAILFFWAPRIVINRKNIILFYGVAFSAFLLIGSTLLGFVRGNVLTKFAEDEGDVWGQGEGYGLLLMMVAICVAAVLFLHNKFNKMSPDRKSPLNFLVTLIFFSSVFQLFATLMATMTRLTFYFYIPVVALIPNCLCLVKDSTRRALLTLSVYMACFIYMGVMIFARVPGGESNSQGVIPYSITITNNEYY